MRRIALSTLGLFGLTASAISMTGCGDPCLDDGRGKAGAVCDPNASGEDATAGTAETAETTDSNESGETNSGTNTDTNTETDGPDENWCLDEDGDGFGDPDNCVPVPEGEDPPPGSVPEDQATDCDDSDPNTFPGAAELDDPDACMTDADDDGWGDDTPSNANAVPGRDCDDDNANAFPGAAENEEPPDACMEDDDMDGWGDTNPGGVGTTPGSDCADDDDAVTQCELWCEDMDMDTFGNPDVCEWVIPGDPPPPGYVMEYTDCLDTDPNVFPGAAELDDPNACMADTDMDGWGDDDPPMGVVPGRDCNDDEIDVVICVDASPGCVDTMDGMSIGLMAQATGGDGNYTYMWSPAQTLDDPKLQNPTATPTATTTYTVIAQDGSNNFGYDEVTIHLSDLPWVLDGNNADCQAVGFTGPPSGHSVSQDGTQVCTTTNSAVPTAYVCPVVHQEAHITGTMTVTDDAGDDDLIGFVWGWQDMNRFYLFQWKRLTQNQNWFNCTGLEGMSVKKIDAQGNFTVQDFACSMDTANATVLLSEMDIGAAGWMQATDYDVDILYDLTQTEITITDATNNVQVANFIVMDDSYPSGQFGTFDFSQVNVCNGPWMSSCL